MMHSLARYICLRSHEEYREGQMYTVEEWGYPSDWGNYSTEFKISGKKIDIRNFYRVHMNIPQPMDGWR